MKMMAEQVTRIHADAMYMPRKNREILERALREKRIMEDELRQAKEAKPLVASSSIDPGFARPVTYPVADMLKAQMLAETRIIDPVTAEETR